MTITSAICLADRCCLPGRSRGDLYSVTTVGGSFRVIAGLQQFFISGSYGETIYKSSSDLDRTRYSISAGVDWRLTGACSGRFAVQTDQSEQSVDTLVVLTGNNIVNTDAINFSGRCHVFKPSLCDVRSVGADSRLLAEHTQQSQPERLQSRPRI